MNSINPKDIDNLLHKHISEIELNIERCGLNHGINLENNPPAVDYLCQEFGPKGAQQGNSLLKIPICAECVIALHSSTQLLCICINCASSQWIFKPESTIEYPDDLHVLYFKKCPKCGRGDPDE